MSDGADTQSIAALFGLSDYQLKGVLETVNKKTLTWANKESAKGLGGVLKIPYKTVRERMRMKFKVQNGILWYGLNRLSAKYGQPLVTGGGVSVGGSYHPNAFRVNSLEGHIFERDGRRGEITSGKNKGKIRERISKVRVPIEDKAMAYLEGFSIDVQDYFMELFIEETEKQTGGMVYKDLNGLTLSQTNAVKQIAPKYNK
jgi:hypothetical protein